MAGTQQVWLITGGVGFIGANFVQQQIARGDVRIVNLDLLTYAGNPRSLDNLHDHPSHLLVHGDIGDQALVRQLLAEYRPTAILNFAAESHVDRSIHGPEAFVQTNVVGTFNLLQEVLSYWRTLSPQAQASFRFLHVSTDEVYGTLAPTAPAFTEQHQYQPNSPYAASKAAADHFVRAFHHTYGLPVLTTNCSNNYGPLQFPEKLIPLMILNALSGKPLPVYGDGQQVRDWLYVEDHCLAIRTVVEQGVVGETYNIGGRSERTNLDVVETIAALLDELRPDSPHKPHRQLIQFVQDRPGHDRRYAINDTKLRETLGWAPRETFESGMRKTVEWYLEHGAWLESIRSAEYQQWINTNYKQRMAEYK